MIVMIMRFPFLPGIVAMPTMPPMSAMATVHEDMHQRAEQQNQIRQSGQQVGLMLRP
jgi:hypothetical protein